MDLPPGWPRAFQRKKGKPVNTTAPTRARQAAPVTAGPVTMCAIAQDCYGSADVPHLANTVTPAIAPSEVLVQVRAAQRGYLEEDIRMTKGLEPLTPAPPSRRYRPRRLVIR